MVRISFHQKLENLRERLLQLAGVAEQTLRFALDAHCRGELSACAKVRLNETIINRSEREIDQMWRFDLRLEPWSGPWHVDLRSILAAIKINSDAGTGRRPVDGDCFVGRSELAGSRPCEFPGGHSRAMA